MPYVLFDEFPLCVCILSNDLSQSAEYHSLCSVALNPKDDLEPNTEVGFRRDNLEPCYRAYNQADGRRDKWLC